MKRDSVIVDMDGCLNHYPDPLKMWAEMMLNLDRRDSGFAIKPENDLERIKKTYRHSKVLEYLLPRQGAREILTEMRNRGYKITLLTSRNVTKNPKIDGVTKSWLEKHNIPFDSVVFSRDKDAYIRDHMQTIALVVEDDPNHLDLFKNMNVEVVAFKNELNQHIDMPHFHRVSSWKEIGSLFGHLMAQ